MVKAIKRLQSTRAGRELWDRLDKRPETIFLSSEPHRYDPNTSRFNFGRTPKRTGNQACYAETDPIWEDTDGDPAAVIGHELKHAELNLDFPNMSLTDTEMRARVTEALIRVQLP